MSFDTGQSERNSQSSQQPLLQQQRRSSYVSQTSRSYSQCGPDLDVITDEELVALINTLKSEVRLIKLENEILENTIKRLDPSLMHGVYQALEYATRMDSSTCLNVGSFLKSHLSKIGFIESLIMSPSRASTRRGESKTGCNVLFGAGPRINILEKSELVSIESELLGANLRKCRQKEAKKSALLNAQLEEVGNRITDTENATKSFKQQVIVEGWDKIAQRIPAEIWIRFLREWLKLSDIRVGKLRLRTSTLNTKYSKLKGQIKVKAELNEKLRPVDFEKLKIENSECVKLIDQKFNHLMELKKMTGDGNLTLTIHKKALMEQNSYLTEVLQNTKSRRIQTIELDKERDLIQAQTDILAQKYNEIRKVRLEYTHAPNILDYLNVKAVVADLKNRIKTLEYREHIQQIALSSINKTLRNRVGVMPRTSVQRKP
ncbi:unnamed protein product [Chrysodeixis includens]|uniref:Cilia- and flagella-associated protein 263 n=1 Tax=Chrysodeixis includens TaxID=689277 RepID=A0A9P0FX54_CHRIL|nr:unnamed protein product [Chrysodeixis includens]